MGIFLLPGRIIGQQTDHSEVEIHNRQRVVANQMLVKFREPLSTERDALLQYIADADRFHGIGGAGWFLIHSRTKKVAELLETAQSFGEIEAAEPDQVLNLFRLPNDPSFSSQSALQNTGQVINGQAGTPGADIKAPAAWDTSTGSGNYVIGVLDTGLDYNHPDLVANVWTAQSQFTVTIGGQQITCAAGTHGYNAKDRTCDPVDGESHGTHVSGIGGAVGNNSSAITGVNWSTKIMALKIDGPGDWNAFVSRAVDAIEFAIQARTHSGIVRVLNASWGCQDQYTCIPCSESGALRDQISRANGFNMLFVAAAGNCATNNDSVSNYPANTNLPNVVSVAATNNKDNLAWFSNYGANKVHLGAPGEGILSTIPGRAYAYDDGTSMAAPHVTGAGTLIRSACAFNTGAIKQTILNNVDSVPSLAGKTVTGGRLNLERALRSCTVGTSGSTIYAYVKYRVCPPFPSWPDSGYAKVTIDGITYTTTWNRNDTPRSIADRLASLISWDSEGTTTVTVSNVSSTCSGKYNARLTLTARAKGPLTNYPYYLTLVDQPPGGCYPCPYFSVAPTAVSHFSGGSN